MTEHALKGTPTVPLTLRRSARARRISLRISQLDGRVTLTLPTGVPEREALAFARSKESWIREHLATRATDWAAETGAELPVEGTFRRIVPASGRKVELRSQEIAVPMQSGPRRLQVFLKELARDRLAAASDMYSQDLGRSYQRITIRDTRSRWGSCSAQGALMYSWRLILAPPEVLEYVAAHEVAHLQEMNHSPAFWSALERIYGPYRESRQWLRDNGSALHRYRF